MKLHNKKTGEIWDIGKVLSNDYPCWETLAQLCEDWEDAKEPLIKDPKIRKAVRAWAEANGIDHIVSYILEDGIEFAGNATRLNIRFEQSLVIDTNRIYSITELCGEEE